MTKIFYLVLDNPLPAEQFHDCLSHLPAAMADRISRIPHWQKSHASLFGKLLLTQCLGTDLNTLHYNAYGRPYIGGGIDFSISHSGKYVACAVSDEARIGFDIEEIRHRPLLHTAAEMDNFYECWTMKEAALKADGRGMNVPMHLVCIRGEQVLIEAQVYYAKRIVIDNDYKAHIASAKPIGDVSMQQVYIQELINQHA